MIHVWSSPTVLGFLFLYFLANLTQVCGVKTLNIGGLFPMTITGCSAGCISGKALLPVSELAVKMVNNRTDVLPGYRLRLVWRDTKCDPGYATNVLFESLYTRPAMIMILGAACTAVTRATAQTVRLWNLLQVSYASTVSELSDKDKYPLLYSIVPPDSSQNGARMAFLKHFRWKRIATIRQNEYDFVELMDTFQESLLNHDFELIASEIVIDDPKPHVERLKKEDARIIVGMFYEDQARRVLCEAFKQGLCGEHYMWLLLDWYDNKQWWLVRDDNIDCTQEEMSRAADGYFSIESARIVSNNEPTVSGMTSEQFLQSYDKPSKNTTDLYLPFAFDSVWMIALTLNNSIHLIRTKLNRSLDNFNYNDSGMVEIFKQTLENLEFQGITGTVKFTKSGVRTRPACIKQMQGGISTAVGTYFPENDKIVFSGAEVLWRGGKPPSDSKLVIYEIQYISTPLFCVIVILASGGILLALYFLWFNVVKRKHSYIKLSSPTLNNLVILGCGLIYISVCMIVIDGNYADAEVLVGICMARCYLLSVGYSLAVGAMFSKIWRVYQIFNNVKPKRKVFSDRELSGVIVLLIVIDVLVVSLWIGVDTLEIITKTLDSQVKDEPHQRTIPQQQHCSSKYVTTWLYILIGYKLLLLLIGCFIAWVTRKVKVHSLNDSRWVGMSVNSIVLCVIVGIPLCFLIDGHVDVHVACLSFFLLFPTTATLCLLFVPKITKLKNNVEEFLRLHSLSSERGSSVSNLGTSNSSIKHQSVNEPNVIGRLQEEIAALKQEIRAIKVKYNENTTPKLSVRIADTVENGRAGSTFSESTPAPRSPRPSLGKRSVTCNTANELGVKTGRKRRRSSSFSGPYLQRRSLDLGLLYSEFPDPVLVLKAENKELHKKLQEARISETGKLAKVLYENAQLNKKIVELNIKNAPSDEAEKVSRLVKENEELKKQLGEVSILNSVWCDVTPRLSRKRNEERKISKDLRELQHLLSVDLGGSKRSSFGPSSINRPPPIGRSQSSSDLQISWDTGNPTEKKTTISPLARDKAKRFSFDSVCKKQTPRATDSRAGIMLTVTDAEKDHEKKPETSPQIEKEYRADASPSICRRDNIDGCESLLGEKINAGFSHEDEWVENPPTNAQDCNCSNMSEALAGQIEGCENEISSQGPKEQLQDTVINAEHQKNESAQYFDRGWTIVTVHEPLRPGKESKVEGLGDDVPIGTAFNHGISEQPGAIIGPRTAGLSTIRVNDTSGIQKPTNQEQCLSANTDKPVSAVKPELTNSRNKAVPSSHVITNFDAVIDQNDNLLRNNKVKNNPVLNTVEVKSSSDENGAIASQIEDEVNVESPDWTLHVDRDEVGSKDKDPISVNEGSPRDVPAYTKKMQRKKDKAKNEKIEKTFFV